MINFKELMQQLSEAGYAAIARAGEREWHSNLTDTAAKSPVKKSSSELAVQDKAHKEKMFGHHAKMLAAAKTRNDVAGVKYHTSKLKQYG